MRVVGEWGLGAFIICRGENSEGKPKSMPCVTLADMKRPLTPKSTAKQAQLRALKTPDVLAQQSALNSTLLGRKSGAHTAENKAQKLAQQRLKEAQLA